MKVNVVVMNHGSFGVNCLVVVEIEKILFVGLCFLLFGGMENVGIGTIGVLRCLGLVAVSTICLSLIWYWLRRF